MFPPPRKLFEFVGVTLPSGSSGRPYITPPATPATSYFEQVIPLAVNVTKELTGTAADKDFIASNSRNATGFVSTSDAKIKKVFLHLCGVAVNTYAGANGLDCTTATHNQWQINLGGGSYSDLKNGANADGQMLDNDWRCPVEGDIFSFHLMFDVTAQITDIDGAIGIRLQNGRSQQSSLYVTASMFLAIVWFI